MYNINKWMKSNVHYEMSLPFSIMECKSEPDELKSDTVFLSKKIFTLSQMYHRIRNVLKYQRKLDNKV